MIKELYREICEDRDVRKNLIALRRELAQEENRRAFAYLLGGDFGRLTGLLDREDPKIRKNAALILGDMETEDVLPFLFHAWEKEETLFIRSDYLKAMKKLDCRRYREAFAERRARLLALDAPQEDRKHVREELLALDAILSAQGRVRRHVFTGCPAGSVDVILMTGPLNREVTARQIHTGTVRMLKSAVRVDGADLEELLPIRTYVRMMFPFRGNPVISPDPERAGEELNALDIPDLLDLMHEGKGIYRYRLDVRGEADPADKARFIRRCSEALDRLSGGKLLNSTSDYEIEIRLVQRKDGTAIPMISLFTVADRRFAYRKEYVADSISPVNAATVMQLARPFLREKAQVLDPFCGVGTMLIERNYCVQASDMYGIDLYGEAVRKAKINTDITGMRVNYINRDFLDFHHDYLFDEIVTDLPCRASGDLTPDLLYDRFLGKAGEVLADGAVLVLYTMEPGLLEKNLKKHAGSYQIRGRYPMLQAGKAETFILRYKADTEAGQK